MNRIPANLWKLALVAALAVAAFALPAPREAEASPCTAACQSQYLACHRSCIDNCTTRIPCYADCVDDCLETRQDCLSHC